MIVDSTSEKHHTAITIDSGDPLMLIRSRTGHYDEVLWDTITTTHAALAEVPAAGVLGGDMPQLFVMMVDSTSKKHHTVITIISDDLVVTYSLPIHQHHEEISNTCCIWVWWPLVGVLECTTPRRATRPVAVYLGRIVSYSNSVKHGS